MTNLWLSLKGKKTYFVSLITILYAVFIIGNQQGDWNQAMQLILGSLGISALRNGMN